MTADDLTRLRAVAHEASKFADGKTWYTPDYLVRGDTAPMFRDIAEFIATCDPPTVLALIDRAERAERERDRLCPDLGITRALSLAQKWDRGQTTAPPRTDETHADSVVRWHCGQELRAALRPEGKP